MKQRLLLITFSVSVLILIGKFYAYYLSGSTTLLTDALESIINVVAGAFAFYSIYLASLPKDLNHPYGHGKIEFFASGLEGVLILLAAAYIFLHASQHLWTNQEIKSLDMGMAISLGSSALNGIMGYFLIQMGKKEHSPTMVADGKHLRLDAYNSLLVVLALAITYFTNWLWVDSAASLLFAFFMFWQGIRLIRTSVAALMDETNPKVFRMVIDWITKNQRDEWIDLHNLRVQQYGGDLHIDCHLTLPRYWDLNHVHEEIHDFEGTLSRVLPTHIEIFVHADPCLDECCAHCQVSDCPIRAHAFQEKIEWNNVNLALNQKHFLEQLNRS
ncbi:cation transporter [Aquirufa nivalisilvae]|uniref:cation diffusion facilitator family transporter n=1 Tax=Aquirufa nivalisilvae TaxID=2516557 RepID=UPI001032FA4A|nr:cation diffusion facilitator family transporter [Aquirufa nivalisilvae]MCZ2482487.1 cation transporter [Aquirufa nivalisilvae]TBH73865.1 cation transporter [Aquirufa nivalisilvae]